MAEAITHNFVSAKTQSADTTLVSKNEWNDGHGYNSGGANQHLVYDGTQTNNQKWVDGAGVSLSSIAIGATASPYSSGTITTIVATSKVTGVLLLFATAITSGGASYAITIKVDGADQAAIGAIPSGAFFTFPRAITLVAGSHEISLVFTASSGTFTSISGEFNTMMMGAA